MVDVLTRRAMCVLCVKRATAGMEDPQVGRLAEMLAEKGDEYTLASARTEGKARRENMVRAKLYYACANVLRQRLMEEREEQRGDLAAAS